MWGRRDACCYKCVCVFWFLTRSKLFFFDCLLSISFLFFQITLNSISDWPDNKGKTRTVRCFLQYVSCAWYNDFLVNSAAVWEWQRQSQNKESRYKKNVKQQHWREHQQQEQGPEPTTAAPPTSPPVPLERRVESLVRGSRAPLRRPCNKRANEGLPGMAPLTED